MRQSYKSRLNRLIRQAYAENQVWHSILDDDKDLAATIESAQNNHDFNLVIIKTGVLDTRS